MIGIIAIVNSGRPGFDDRCGFVPQGESEINRAAPGYVEGLVSEGIDEGLGDTVSAVPASTYDDFSFFGNDLQGTGRVDLRRLTQGINRCLSAEIQPPAMAAGPHPRQCECFSRQGILAMAFEAFRKLPQEKRTVTEVPRSSDGA
ncbi:hypothetical protein DF19_08805 [Streptomyces olindensis]|nr:hypothetical protein DF19_18745 [Streptomyces olindensis]KDN77684.1 hypothetical protein DF19_08805 [Streptomyces olindensis]